MMKVLIIGGYGRFGGNLARLLSDCIDLTLFIAGRNLHKAEAFCAAFEGTAKVRPLKLDRNAPNEALQRHAFDLVVDASGPFQIYGNAPYTVVESCLVHGIHYMDLADSADFVANIDRFNARAKTAGVAVLSGVSTCPALSGAVIEALSTDMTVKDITIGIAPSPRAALGLSVIKAILSYAGTALPTLRDGKPDSYIGLAETRRFQIAPQDYPPLENRLFSAVEAPELRLLPQIYPELENLWIGAGTRPEFLLRLLTLLAKMKSVFNWPSLTPLAPLAHKIMSFCKFGKHRGGMFVSVKGIANHESLTRQWHLIAEGDDGPLIPAIAAEALIRKMLAGEYPEPGARAATQELTLKDFETGFARHQIITSCHPLRRFAPSSSELSTPNPMSPTLQTERL